jgi:hypothetical protein
MLFQALQSGHFPSHFGAWQPHFWQVKTVLCFTDHPLMLDMMDVKTSRIQV